MTTCIVYNSFSKRVVLFINYEMKPFDKYLPYIYSFSHTNVWHKRLNNLTSVCAVSCVSTTTVIFQVNWRDYFVVLPSPLVKPWYSYKKSISTEAKLSFAITYLIVIIKLTVTLLRQTVTKTINLLTFLIVQEKSYVPRSQMTK